jgi:hypothetical protein
VRGSAGRLQILRRKLWTRSPILSRATFLPFSHATRQPKTSEASLHRRASLTESRDPQCDSYSQNSYTTDLHVTVARAQAANNRTSKEHIVQRTLYVRTSALTVHCHSHRVQREDKKSCHKLPALSRQTIAFFSFISTPAHTTCLIHHHRGDRREGRHTDLPHPIRHALK